MKKRPAYRSAELYRKTDKLPDGATDTVKYLTEATFDNDLKQIRADETGIDFIIVCVQWSGDSAELTDSQKAWAQTFADNDVDVVLGLVRTVSRA